MARHWRVFVYVLNVCRFSLIVLLAGAVLLNVGQGQDMLLSAAEDNRWLLLVSSCLLWALSIWLWARTLLEIRFPGTPEDWEVLAIYRRWVPRVLGVLPFLLVAWSAFDVGPPASTRFIWPTLIVGALFAGLVVFRRRIGRFSARVIAREQAEQSRLWVGELEAAPPRLTSLWGASSEFFGRVALLLLALGLVMFVWGVYDPLSMGARFNSLVLLMVWGATFLPIGSLVTYYGNKTGLPLVSLLFAIALVSSYWNDNHAIRPLPGDAPAQRVSAAEALDAWAQKHCKRRGNKDECGPLVVVATAGGGIRAAYWTATVLGHLEDHVQGFHDRLFAVSGVSGGSVGATVYRSVLTAAAHSEQCRGKVLDCSTRVLSQDFLSPLSASLLYPDLLQRFFPVAFLPDRAKTLEMAWERSFEKETGSNALAGSFSALGADKQAPWPVLFLNATWSNNGRRVVAATAKMDGDSAFRIANDQLARIGYDIRVSTAAHNSARFPYVSPPGSWHEGKGEDKTAGPVLGRLQDGGLFENYGAETALEILALAEQRLDGKSYTPVVILISSDPALRADFAKSRHGRRGNFAYEILTTLRTMMNTREGRGAEAAGRLRAWAQKHGSFAYFRMCDPREEEAEPPLGWALSDHARRQIEGYLLERPVSGKKDLPPSSCRGENRGSAQQVCESLLPVSACTL
jgi:hypothetical protein